MTSADNRDGIDRLADETTLEQDAASGPGVVDATRAAMASIRVGVQEVDPVTMRMVHRDGDTVTTEPLFVLRPGMIASYLDELLSQRDVHELAVESEAREDGAAEDTAENEDAEPSEDRLASLLSERMGELQFFTAQVGMDEETTVDVLRREMKETTSLLQAIRTVLGSISG